MLELKSITKKYKKDIVALDDINIKLPDVGLVFLSGDSGSGKSTLLNIISTLEDPTDGTILFNGKELVSRNKKDYLKDDVSIIFQDNNLFDNLSVYDNLNIYENTNIEEILKKLDISDLRNKCVKHLSGGEKRRVSIGRAILKNPKVLLCDEPDASLDEENRENIYNILKDLSSNMLVIVSSHDADKIEEYANRVITILAGKIVSDKEIKKEKVKNIKDSSKFIINKKFLNIVSKDIIFANKIGFTFAVIILTFFVTAILLAGVLSEYDFVDILTNTVIHEGDTALFVQDAPSSRMFSTGTIKKVFEDGKEYNFKYSYLGMKFGNYDNEYFLGDDDVEDPVADFYYALSSNGKFYTFNDDFVTGELIGKKPVNADEVVIYELMAERIMYHGVYLPDGNIYKPNSIEDLINKEVVMGDLTVKIVGIIRQDLARFQVLKDENFYLYAEENLKDKILADLFGGKISRFASYTLVTDEFYSYIEGHYEEEAPTGYGGVKFVSDKKSIKEYLKKENPKKNYDLYKILMVGGIGSIGLELYGTSYASSSSIITYPYLFGQAVILLSPVLIVIMVYVILMYFENVYKKNRQKFAILTSLGLTVKNMNKVYFRSALISFGSSLMISVVLVLISMILGNVWLSDFVGFYLHPFAINIKYCLISIGIILFTFILSYIFLKLRVKKRNAIIYLKNN